MDIRKHVIVTEKIIKQGGHMLEKPVTRVAAIAVITNPFADEFVEDLTVLMDIGEQLGAFLGEKAAAALPGGMASAESYGKGAIVGMGGELEHAAAILHPKLGKPFREALGGGKAIIPSAKKMGPPGTALDVPTHFKDAAFVRSHFDAVEIRVQDAPRKEEIVVALVVTDGGRPFPRVGGLKKEEVKGEEGLR